AVGATVEGEPRGTVLARAVVGVAVNVLDAAPVLHHGESAQVRVDHCARVQQPDLRFAGQLYQHRSHCGEGGKPGVGPPWFEYPGADEEDGEVLLVLMGSQRGHDFLPLLDSATP